MSLEKGLNLIGTQAGKVLTIDETGKAISTDTNVADLVTKDITNEINTRLTALEGSIDEAVTLVKNING